MDLGSRYIQLTPDSSSISNVVYDNIISRDKDMALITNSLISETIIDVLIKGDSLSHKLDLVRDLPNFVTENGPDLEIIYEIRNGDFAKRVRRNKQWNSLNKVIFDSNFSTASTPINASTGNLPQRYFFFSPEILPTEYSQVSY